MPEIDGEGNIMPNITKDVMEGLKKTEEALQTRKEAVTEALNMMMKFADSNLISDGYHTFGELYDHRIELFIALCRILSFPTAYAKKIWKCQIENGWFIMGINTEKGKQITYHLPASKWDETDFCTHILGKEKYFFDGHTSADVLKRLKEL